MGHAWNGNVVIHVYRDYVHGLQLRTASSHGFCRYTCKSFKIHIQTRNIDRIGARKLSRQRRNLPHFFFKSLPTSEDISSQYFRFCQLSVKFSGSAK
jgi:hypothetical protein